LDNLYEEASYETRLVKKSGKLKSTFANRPVQVAADKDEILKVLNI